MSLPSYKQHFRHALGLHGERLHFAAHSHHLWPDVAREAHLRAFDEAAELADLKWDRIFGELLPAAQGHLARELGVSDPSRFAFAPNVHDLFVRLVSCIEHRGPLRVLSTGSEFHSFTRQMKRWSEGGAGCPEIHWVQVSAEPFESLADRLAQALEAESFDLFYASQVFFDSGYEFREVFDLAEQANPEALVCIDGYHGYGALPTDLDKSQSRVFYTAGGYKYAMSGEGVCFLHCPDGVAERPVDTGWFAGFGALESAQTGLVPYGPGGARFLGATFDPTSLYRFVAVQEWLQELGLGAAERHARSLALQERFLERIAEHRPAGLEAGQLVVPSPERRGNFLTFRRADATEVRARLIEAGIVTDARADRLRFGFGLYHDLNDVDALVDRMRSLLPGPERS